MAQLQSLLNKIPKENPSIESASMEQCVAGPMLKVPNEWADEMNIGVDAIDTDHINFFKMLNRIRVLSEKGSNPSIIGSVLAELHEYTLLHFEREEAVMEACGHPDLEDHKLVHLEFQEKVEKLLSEPSREENADMQTTLLNFLENWLVEHILEMDKSIQIYVEKQQGALLHTTYEPKKMMQ
jgi:hemerythrin